MNSKKRELSVSIVGLGNWGTSLLHALHAAGVPVSEIIVRGKKRRPVLAQGVPSRTLHQAALQADVLWLCVPDAALAGVAQSVAGRATKMSKTLMGKTLKGTIVVHSSGALGAEVLRPVEQAGASIASVHPLMTFPTRKPVALKGVPFGIEADEATRRRLSRLVRRLGGRPFTIQAGSKPLYHVVGTLASPLLVSHLVVAERAAALAGFSAREARALIEPIVRATVDNVFARGPDASFSGPIARGDLDTIRLHLRALQPHPMLASVYRSLALYAVEVLPGSGKPGSGKPESGKRGSGKSDLRRLLRPVE